MPRSPFPLSDKAQHRQQDKHSNSTAYLFLAVSPASGVVTGWAAPPTAAAAAAYSDHHTTHHFRTDSPQQHHLFLD